MRCRRLRRRRVRRSVRCAVTIDSNVDDLSARFSAACSKASRANSCASSAAICRRAAARAAASGVATPARRSAKRDTTAAITPLYRADTPASMDVRAARRAARWLAISSCTSASCSATRARRERARTSERLSLSSPAVRVSRGLRLGLSEAPVTGPAPSPCRGHAPSTTVGLPERSGWHRRSPCRSRSSASPTRALPVTSAPRA